MLIPRRGAGTTQLRNASLHSHVMKVTMLTLQFFEKTEAR
jgi:hypothetical protein